MKLSQSRATYEIVFDGGSLGNPGKGYGSFRLRSPAGTERLKRLEFGPKVTNNEAEYLALIAALEELLYLVDKGGKDAGKLDVVVRGDSQLVIYQLQGRWRVRKAELQLLHQEATNLLKHFGSYSLEWQERARSVAALGH